MIQKAMVWRFLYDYEYIYGKVFASIIQGLILISLVAFSIGTLPDLSSDTKDVLYGIEVFTVIIFTIEYILRFIVAERKFEFVFSFHGLVDLAAILPFYIFTGLDLRSVRVFRLFQLVRILKLFKYSKAFNRFHRALIIAREELILFGFIAMILLYLSAVGIYYCEYAAQPEKFKSVFHSLWWAVTTLTTVGYGDMFPVTSGGKIFTFFVLIVGLGIVAVPTGLISTALSQARERDQ
ncbi:ion transporter [Photobacterium sagamiensis]|uniref:ion transporter n=1 Tax=Photobacterium sagamiensis TaxID=2910241 RepID=UPI003D114028